jgi:hypothetical protein
VKNVSVADAAKILDGASCIAIIKQKGPSVRGYRYRLTVLARRRDRDELELIRLALDIRGEDGELLGHIAVLANGQFELMFQGVHAVSVLSRITPWLLERSDEARVALEFWKHGEFSAFPAGPVPSQVWDVRDAKYLEMRQLKEGLAGRPRHSIVSRGKANPLAAL